MVWSLGDARSSQNSTTSNGTRRWWLAAPIIAVAAAAAAWHDRVAAPDLGRPTIFLGPGCGHVAYTMGFVGGLLDDAALRAALLRARAAFGGASSGALTAAYAMAALHGAGTMEHWYASEMRRGYEAVRNASTLVMGGELERAGLRFHAAVAGVDGARPPPWLGRFPIASTESLTLRPRFVSDFSAASGAAFARELLASSYVPGVMGLAPWVAVPDDVRGGGGARADGDKGGGAADDGRRRRVFDGFTGLWRAALPDSYLLVHFLPGTLPRADALSKHRLLAYEVDSSEEWLLAKAWPWGDPEWADAAFHRGMADATAHRAELRAQVLRFLDAQKPVRP